MMENKRSVTTNQLILLLEELEMNPSLNNERMLNVSKRTHDAQWNALVEKLNAVPNGAKRSVSRWKTVLSNWKLTIQRQTQSDQNMDSAESLDELGKRLLQLVEEENVSPDVDMDMDIEHETENQNVFRRPQLVRPQLVGTRKRTRRALAGLRQPLLNRRMEKSLMTIFDNNQDDDCEPDRKIMRMQLDRLHEISVRLENHIQSMQNRIQAIKDMWHHECIDQ